MRVFWYSICKTASPNFGGKISLAVEIRCRWTTVFFQFCEEMIINGAISELYGRRSMFSHQKDLIRETVAFTAYGLALSWYRITLLVNFPCLLHFIARQSVLMILWNFWELTVSRYGKKSLKISPSWYQNTLYINFLVDVSVLNLRSCSELLCRHWVELLLA